VSDEPFLLWLAASVGLAVVALLVLDALRVFEGHGAFAVALAGVWMGVLAVLAATLASRSR
jgi:hypothetical protein